MGIGPSWGRSAGVSQAATPTSQTAPNPNPHRFQIRWIKEYADVTVAQVYYPDCTTFDGEKILVFAGRCAARVRALKKLDPHFTEDSEIIARVRPGAAGEVMLRRLTSK